MVVAHAKAAYAAGLSEPGPSRIQRFLWGFTLPLAVGRAVARDPATRARYEEIAVTQLAAVFAITATLGLFGAHHWARAREHASVLQAILEVGSSVYALASAVEWGVIALSRDFHAELSARASWLTAVPPEPLAAPPRLRLDLAWLRTKVRRRIREALLVASGLPAAALVLMLPQVGPYLYAALGAAWTAYWIAVFAIASSHHAWTEPAPPPWFVRGAITIGSVPFFGLPARIYARLWARLSASVHPACAALEKAPYEAAGLALARTIGGLPGVYIATRPLFPVAAAHALRVRAAR